MKTFKKLNIEKKILILANVWDVNSAIKFEKMGYKALGTSSAAIANSLGLEDGEEMSFDELLEIIKNIQSKINIPLNVDFEAGYSRNIKQICENIKKLADLGIVGINLEDSIVENKKREILDADNFSEIITKVKKYIEENNLDIFLNIRTDFYIMGLENPLENSLKRIKKYEKAGADGIFIPCVTNNDDIQKLVKHTLLPINVMTMPGLADFEILEKLGVKRISMGPFIFNKINENFEKIIKNIEKEKSFKSLFN